MDDFFRFSKKKLCFGILGPPYSGIGATIRIGREMLCVLYAGFFALNNLYSLCQKGEKPLLKSKVKE